MLLRIESDSTGLQPPISGTSGWPARLLVLITGLILCNRSTSGYNVTAAPWSVQHPIDGGNYLDADAYVVGYGINDNRFWNTVAQFDYFRGGLESMALWFCLRAGSRVNAAQGTGFTFLGSWVASSIYWGAGKSGGAGASVSGVCAGTRQYISVIRTQGGAGTYSIRIGAITYGPFSAGGANMVMDPGNQQYPEVPMLHSFPCAPGDTWEIDVISAGVIFNWAGSNTGVMKPVVLSNIPYACGGVYPSGGSNAGVDALNSRIASIVADGVAAGLPLKLVDIHSVIVDADYTAPENYHYGDSGAAKIAPLFRDALIGAPTYNVVTPIFEQRVSDNTLWATLPGQTRKQIQML